jgi:mono/diheme cytochrome c family protein
MRARRSPFPIMADAAQSNAKRSRRYRTAKRAVKPMKLRRVAVALMIGWLLAPHRASAGDGNPGREVYFKYCSSCHGEDGRGGGEAARGKRPKPADLTQLTRSHRGAFPAEHVKAVIDGGISVAAHGTTRMPAWGKVFSQEQAYAPPDAHRQSQLRLLVDYLRSIQTN